jgi:DNA uptake protein ComE-like DNA-binding protein
MKAAITIVIVAACYTAIAQERESLPVQEQQLENQAEATEMETEDDAYWQQVEYLRSHPLNLNEAETADLEALPMLSPLQVANFLRHRNLFGKLVSLHELQAIPGWDLGTIHKLLPLVMLDAEKSSTAPFRQRFRGGEHALLLRFSQATPGDDQYEGSGLRIFSRYRYNYKSLLQYGLTTDKDAGEAFFRGRQKAGFDFYSFHLFARKLGTIRSLALGDFTINLGQGLTHWQSLAFKKSGAVLQVKRQGPVLKPYNAAGEYNFHRGAGITFRYKQWETTLFGSFRKLDANLVADSVTSILTSGYHRTAAELDDRLNLDRITIGGNLKYSRQNWHIGINMVQYRFSKPFKTSGQPYDIFAVEGKNGGNHSIDYSFTHRNRHLFGEAALDQNFRKALLNGLLMSLDPKVDISLVHRHIDKNYQSLQGNAFTENYLPGNEQGLYAGLSLRPAVRWQLDAHADLFRFPWLKYRVNAPGHGAEYLLQLLYTPVKGTEIVSRYRYEHKPVNAADGDIPVKPVVMGVRHNWRTQVVFQTTRHITLKSRVELVRYQRGNETAGEKGFSAFTEIFYKAPWSFAANMRLHYFETDGYDSRIYAYEQDVQYAFSIPMFKNKGLRYYVNLKQNLSALMSRRRIKKMDCVVWFRMARFLYPYQMLTGSALDERSEKNKTEFKFQVLLTVSN